MRWRTVGTLMTLLAATAAASAAAPAFVPGELIVRFRDTVPQLDRVRLLREMRIVPVRMLPGTGGALLVRLPGGAATESTGATLASRPEFSYAVPNGYVYADVLPDDTDFPDQWGLHNVGQTGGLPDADIDAPEAWDLTIGSPQVVVAVIDSGFDLTHPDLAPNLFVNPGEIPENGLDDDGNGYVDDVHGYDFVDGDGDPTDPDTGCGSHGTHLAGIIGAAGNNGFGTVGVSPRVRLMAVRALSPVSGFCGATVANLVDALAYATRMGVPVSNNSWGTSQDNPALHDAVLAARHLFVTSAGNSSVDIDLLPDYPASWGDLPHLVSVAATNQIDDRASFSNYGLVHVDLGAPGRDVLSTVLGGYGFRDGTSVASPFVVGAAALLLHQDPTATPEELKWRLLRGVDLTGLVVASGGRLNVFRSLTLPASPVRIQIDPLSSTSLEPGELLQVRYRIRNGSSQPRTVNALLWVWMPDGNSRFLLGPAPVMLTAGQTRSGTFSRTVPSTLPAGEHRVIGRVWDGQMTFDESAVSFQIGAAPAGARGTRRSY